jgi:uncharacterized protein (DUF1501 family)
MTALATQLEHFGMLSALAQKSRNVDLKNDATSEYRALVCIFLSGGTDGNNTIIPNHSDASVSNYSAYSAARAAQSLAIPQASLLPISVPRIGNLTYGLHPSFGPGVTGGINNGVHDLWALGKMAVVTNAGTLIQPLTRQQYQSGTAPRPFQLFSHSDQVSQQQTARADALSLTGWGGRISDKITAPQNPGALIPTITTLSGGVFCTGQNTQPVAIGAAPAPLNSVLALTGYNGTPAATARLDALENGMELDGNHELIDASNDINARAIEISRSLSTSNETTVPFPATQIGNELKQIARMIKSHSVLNANRQIFFASIGGFDTHTQQLANQAALLAQLSQASRAFYEEMVVQGLSNQVTQFTLSDFSRTFNPAGSGANAGSDHAWANHMFVIGGSVLGGDFYGVNTSNGTPFPTLVQDGPDDADGGGNARGRWIPTTSVEQYAATLARWFEVPEADMDYVFPNLRNFPTTNLGFMMP